MSVYPRLAVKSLLEDEQNMPLTRYIDTPFSWAVVGFAIGAALGVNFISVVLVALGLGAFVLYMYMHGPAKPESEGWLFAGAPAFIIAWMVGFFVNSLVF